MMYSKPSQPFLYNLYMDYLLRVFLLECNKKNIKFTKLKYIIPANAVKGKQKRLLGSYGQFYLDWIGYTDDLVIAFADIISLQRGLTLLDEIFTHYVLTFLKQRQWSLALPLENTQLINVS